MRSKTSPSCCASRARRLRALRRTTRRPAASPRSTSRSLTRADYRVRCARAGRLPGARAKRPGSTAGSARSSLGYGDSSTSTARYADAARAAGRRARRPLRPAGVAGRAGHRRRGSGRQRPGRRQPHPRRRAGLPQLERRRRSPITTTACMSNYGCARQLQPRRDGRQPRGPGPRPRGQRADRRRAPPSKADRRLPRPLRRPGTQGLHDIEPPRRRATR